VLDDAVPQQCCKQQLLLGVPLLPPSLPCQLLVGLRGFVSLCSCFILHSDCPCLRFFGSLCSSLSSFCFVCSVGTLGVGYKVEKYEMRLSVDKSALHTLFVYLPSAIAAFFASAKGIPSARFASSGCFRTNLAWCLPHLKAHLQSSRRCEIASVSLH
jgi:hypothetical protein